VAKARKTRRAKKRGRSPRQVRAGTVVSKASVAVQQPEPVSFAEEYRYVVADLRRIFFLAAGMFALLIVLALVLQ
jgi:hypothetical protein